MSESLSYKDAGVDIEAGYASVKKFTPKVKSTFNSQVLDNFGSFGGLFCPDISEYEYFDFLKYKDIIQKWYKEAQNILKHL